MESPLRHRTAKSRNSAGVCFPTAPDAELREAQNAVGDPAGFTRTAASPSSPTRIFENFDGGSVFVCEFRAGYQFAVSMPSASCQDFDAAQNCLAAAEVVDRLDRVFAGGVDFVPIGEERFPDARGESRRSTG